MGKVASSMMSCFSPEETTGARNRGKVIKTGKKRIDRYDKSVIRINKESLGSQLVKRNDTRILKFDGRPRDKGVAKDQVKAMESMKKLRRVNIQFREGSRANLRGG